MTDGFSHTSPAGDDLYRVHYWDEDHEEESYNEVLKDDFDRMERRGYIELQHDDGKYWLTSKARTVGEAMRLAAQPIFFSVALFETGQAYGGPEEGGWYYSYGVPVNYLIPELGVESLPKFFMEEQEEEARLYRANLQKKIEELRLNKGKYGPSSVLDSGDWLVAQLEEGMPEAYPKHRPHYE